jgi:endonuclease/exonuclease/phosphatase (EEP) superfamily protein YafD
MKLWVALACLAGCALEPNYLDPAGPRYAGSAAGGEGSPGPVLLVVSYNLAFGLEVQKAIAALQTPPLSGADLVLMQEMDPAGVERIATTLDLHWVYYPASVKHGRDWGNAILSRWPLVGDRKLLLPHADPYTNTRRIAVTARARLGGRELLVYSTHIATPALGLGARLDQIQTIVDAAADLTPALIGGDLNTGDPGSADQVRDLFAARQFVRASEMANGSGSRLGARITLDYLFARGLTASASGTFGGDAGSDHQPIWVTLPWP